ncbi:MAG TPA: alpha/beta hydrolase [Chthonomonadaceae bacterium]|nr:alpha/beta hydrolase [Chthonomonadaceae bacterium]
MQFISLIAFTLFNALGGIPSSVETQPPASTPGLAAYLREEIPLETPTEPMVAQRHETLPLWPGTVPGEKGDIGEEKDTTPVDKSGKRQDDIIRLGNVSHPTITIYRPPHAKDTGAAVVVCPGGGYSILAMNLEGSEVCTWLNSMGVTGILLKYRVPGREGLEKHTAALQDAQRALGIVRHRAKEWGIDPKRIGILGLSAGGHLSATASTNFEKRTYPTVDEADKESCRPDFTVLIYPAYLTLKNDLTRLAPEIKVTSETPPTFLAMTEDDSVHVENVFVYGLALKNAGVPFELHVYPTGGHGYGLRPSENEVSHWPQRVERWLTTQGWLKPRP